MKNQKDELIKDWDTSSHHCWFRVVIEWRLALLLANMSHFIILTFQVLLAAPENLDQSEDEDTE